MLFDYYSVKFPLVYLFIYLWIISMSPTSPQKPLNIICSTSHHENYNLNSKYFCTYADA